MKSTSLKFPQRLARILVSALCLVAVALFLSAAIEAAEPCPTHFSQLQTSDQSPQNLLNAALESGLKVERENGGPLYGLTFRWDELSPEHQTLLEKIPALSAPERAKYLARLKKINTKTPSSEDKLKELIQLGLYDRETWLTLTKKIERTEPAASFAANYLPLLDEHMPAPLREEILGAIGKKYPNLSKQHLSRAPLAPKRLADYYFKQLLRGDLLINSAIEAGKTPLEAFTLYVNEVQRFIQRGPMYDTPTTLEMLKSAQKNLREHIAKLDRANISAKRPPELYLGGSLPNGRASLAESDLDYSASFNVPASVEKKLGADAKALVAKISPKTKFETVNKDLPMHFWAQLHPLVIRVREDSIELIVYKNRLQNGKLSDEAGTRIGVDVQVYRLD